LNRHPDILTTIVLLGPMFGLLIAAWSMRWYREPRRARRLTDGDVRRMYPAIADRMGRVERR
jgi:hypothetical protein